MEDKFQIIDEQILASLAGELDAAGEHELHEWMDSAPENKARYDQLRDIWIAAGASSSSAKFDAPRAFERFKSKRFPSDRPIKSKAWIWQLASVAATLALVFFLAFQGGRLSVGCKSAPVMIEAPQGSMTQVVLPDGTKVRLNSCSSLSWSPRFGSKDRQVTLSGEGFFEVARNENLPFVVASDHLAVKVIGTRFDFRDYSEDREASVSLVEGRISLLNLLESGQSEKYLSPGQQVTLEKRSGVLRVDSKDPAHSSLWAQGILFFDEVTLYDIARELERCYDVDVHIEREELSDLRIYGNFQSREQCVEDILNLLVATQNLNYSKSGRTIRIF